MKLTAILVAVALAAMAAPAQAYEYDVEERNAAWVMNYMANHAAALDADLEIDWDAPEAPLAAVGDVVDRMGNRDITRFFETTEETGDFPLAGDIWIIESLVSFGAPANGCKSGGGGTGGHADLAESSVGVEPYPLNGVATSAISTEGFGLAIGWDLAKAVGYSEEVAYGGNSDFWCIEFDFFGIFFVLNFPFLLGAAQGLEI